ncbi:DNA-directed DNA polymerase alpha catalytic subunit pol1 [Gryganskiella cystojenkinii]|nr:DNA-directed DNA polymerase alpha catalytic subunit pol1 [Gryganskiella cystojenkinii]
MSSRSKRTAASGSSKFAALKELRTSGRSRLSQYEVQEAEDIYEEEEDERIIKRLRQDHSNFVEDDDGRGYADDGSDDQERFSDEFSDEEPVKGKGKSSVKDAPKPKARENIMEAFMKADSRPKAFRPTPAKRSAEDDDLLNSILQGMDAPAQPTISKRPAVTQPKRVAMSTPTRALISKLGPLKIKDEEHDEVPRNLSSRLDDFHDNDFDDFQPDYSPAPEPEIKKEFKKEDINDHLNRNSPFQVSENEEDDDADEPATLAVKPIMAKNSKLPMQLVNDTSKKEVATVVKKSETDDNQNWMTVDDNLNQTYAETKTETDSPTDVQESNIKEEDGTLRMYWLDACEVRGVVYLFGKVLQRSTDTYVSCCVVVQNLERNLYVLPRTHRMDKQGNETTVEVDLADVLNEFQDICTSHRVTKALYKNVNRKYAFELPGIPTVAEYLKVIYNYSQTSLPADLTGETFSHVFGTNTNALEHFIIKRNLMGPTWLEIKDATMNSAKSSWCKTEFTVTNAKNIKPMKDSPDLPPPPICVMSLSLRTINNEKEKTNEIASVSTSVYHEVRLDGPVENNRRNLSKQILIRKLATSPFPPGFDNIVDRNRKKIVKMPSERALLNMLLARIVNTDPDVIVGHNFVGFDLDVLLHRMKHTKADHWSRIGRLRRTVWPKLQSGAGGTGDTTAQEKNIMSGRLMCDTYLGAKEHMRASSYSLTNLVSMKLNINRDDIEYDKLQSYYSSADQLERMLKHSDFDTYLCAELMFSLQLLPLSRQLTTLSGNLWSATLTAGRAVRNEYLLLHEFHRDKYICPDKTFNKDNFKDAPLPLPAAAADGDNDDLDEGTGGPGGSGGGKKGAKRKPQYAGGLVLEPKKGFYDQFVLLLDFNSLYPSIIQEYNICFTTVKLDNTKEDTLPEYPEEGLPKGILPRLLENLVSRRREVKRLMKNATGATYEEYNIRQQGLKLTANSMYGCLGAAYSRFYAKQLAMLITSRGREILQNTVDLATQNGLDVIYGDTDSIMINTNTTKIEEVKPVADGLKKLVNARYKLLEIEMDGMYQRMLLLKKKKYAALVVQEKNGRYERSIEKKGLDTVRRDWCGLSHDVSNYVLDQILANDNKDREQVLENIHNYLRIVGEETRKGLIPMEKFVVNKGLTKSPEDYADAKVQPHVQVALRMKSKGISVRAGDTVPYVICIHDGTTAPSKGGYAERAYHPDEVRQPGSGLTIDFEYYLANQVHPPLDRLCGPIEGTDASRLADCLGLDTTKFRSSAQANVENDELQSYGSTITDAERYKDAEPLQFLCRSCQTSFSCTALHMEKDSTSHFGLQCPSCSSIVQPASATVQLTNAIRKYIQRFYQGWVVCDDQGCKNRTRMVSVVGRRCLSEGCRGRMNTEYSAEALYTQLSYFGHIFDLTKALEKIDFNQHGAVQVQMEQNRDLVRQLKATADRYIKKSGQHEVDLSQLFSFIKVSSTR